MSDPGITWPSRSYLVTCSCRLQPVQSELKLSLQRRAPSNGLSASNQSLQDEVVEVAKLPEVQGTLASSTTTESRYTNKMKSDTASAKTIDGYISGFPAEVQNILARIRGIVKDAAPEAAEAIKYQIPTFVLNGNLVHFAAFEKHIGFYPTPSGIEQFKKALSKYKSAKGSVQFPLNSPIPYGLIKKIVAFRVKENREKG